MAAVALLHLGVLGAWGLWRPAPGGGPAATATVAARQVVVALRPVPDLSPARVEPSVGAGHERVERTPSAQPVPAAASAPPEGLGDAAPPRSAVLPGPGQADDEYLPRSALTLGPEPTAEVLLAYPDHAPDGRWQGVLTLFIDERGQVQRVRVESTESELPPPFQEAARQAFLAARFTPGQWQGQAVRSRIRIAVEFESTVASPGQSAAQR